MKLAILVPYRNRPQHLAAFLPHMRKHLPDADIYIIEQGDNKPFNRGKLLNIGWLETRDEYGYFALHDVDMLPYPGVDYSWVDDPTHLATQASQFHYKLPYPEYFGGVTLVNNLHMTTSRGFSNEMWGWGAEDDEFRRELMKWFKLESRPGRFECFDHPRPVDWEQHTRNVLRLKQPRQPGDGIDGCHYTVTDVVCMGAATKITVEL